MSEEPKGFYNKKGELLERKKPITTKNGIIVYKGKWDFWYLEFPDDSRRIGSVKTIRLMNLIYHLNKTHGNVDKSRKLSEL